VSVDFDKFARGARALDRVSAVVDSVGILRPALELLPGNIGRVARAVASADSQFAGIVFRFRMNQWESFDSPWVRHMATDRCFYTIGGRQWIVANFGGVPVVWSSDWNGTWTWCPVSLARLLAIARVDGPALVVAGATGNPGDFALRRDLEPVPTELSATAKDAVAKTRAIRGCRSWLFVGPPGSGKTTIARQLAAAIGDGSWLMLGPGVARRPEVWELVHVLGPAAIVIDDIDSASGEDMDIALRTGLAEARRYAKVIAGTANTLKAVRGSLIRPGRFDEGPVIVDKLEHEVAASIGYALPKPVLERALETGLLAAYLHELNLRVLVGRDPEVELPDLVARMTAAGDR
jgi:hypothetical protein